MVLAQVLDQNHPQGNMNDDNQVSSSCSGDIEEKCRPILIRVNQGIISLHAATPVALQTEESANSSLSPHA